MATCNCERRGLECGVKVYIGTPPNGRWVCETLVKKSTKSRMVRNATKRKPIVPKIEFRDDLDTKHLCRYCSIAGNKHLATTGLCPPRKPWPDFPDSVERTQGMDAAQALYKKRLDAYWAASPGTFYVPY